MKNLDSKSFLPCQRVLVEQIRKAWFVSKLYIIASMAYAAENYTEIDLG